jgi:hypothetical protein
MAGEGDRVFCHTISKSLSNPDWPAPDLDPTSVAGRLGPLVLQGAQTLLTGSGPLAQVVHQLIKVIPVPPPAFVALPGGGESK